MSIFGGTGVVPGCGASGSLSCVEAACERGEAGKKGAVFFSHIPSVGSLCMLAIDPTKFLGWDTMCRWCSLVCSLFSCIENVALWQTLVCWETLVVVP